MELWLPFVEMPFAHRNMERTVLPAPGTAAVNLIKSAFKVSAQKFEDAVTVVAHRNMERTVLLAPPTVGVNLTSGC
jgi:hypothetical protein